MSEKRPPATRSGERAKPKTKPLVSELTEKEIGGPKGPEPTRFGDWEKGGRCFDF